MQRSPYIRIVSFLIAGLSLSTNSLAVTPECVAHFNPIDSWQSLDHSNLLVRDPVTHDVYQLTLERPLSALSHSTSITLKDVDHDKRICSASNDLVIANSVVSDGQELKAVIATVRKLASKDIPALEKEFGTVIRIQGWKQIPKTPARETAH
jgi:Family of unknown function (DUF6491)